MTIKQRYNLNKMIYTTKFVKIDKETLLYYKAYIRIFNNWADIVDGMNKDTLSCVYPTMRKLFRKNVITYLQTYIRSDIIYGIEIANTYGADVIKLLLEY